MTTLTKEEYLSLVEILAFEYGYLNLKEVMQDTKASAIPYQKLIELINEHFELKYQLNIRLDTAIKMYKKIKNEPPKPLKFEELKPGMWVWDNRIKAYLKIQEIWVNKVIHFDNCCVVCFFQENRFYRDEVKEDE